MFDPFKTVTGIAVPIDEPNIDTNQLCPTRFNKLRRNDPYYPKVLFHDQRFSYDGETLKPDFILNRVPYTKTKIIVADRNWGIGSSRESAVYALLAFGVRVVVASSFGDIHRNNCMRNGVLPVELPQATVEALRKQLLGNVGAEMTVDLPSQVLTAPDGAKHSFEIHPLRKRCMLEGLDDISLTQRYLDKIEAFEAAYRKETPSAVPVSPS